MKRHAKHHIPPPFTSESARRAQRLGVKSRRVNDLAFRQELVEALGEMSQQLRQRLVDHLGQRAVDALVVAAREERGQ